MTSPPSYKFAIAGCTGRMGRLLLKEIALRSEIKIVGALTRPGNPLVGKDIGMPYELEITDQPLQAFQNADVVIDFSAPVALEEHLKANLKHNKPFLVCTTGLTEAHYAALEVASQTLPLLIAPNTSLAIALLRKVSVLAAHVLGPSYDISLLEMHHRHKADAPSGTLLSLAKGLEKFSPSLDIAVLRGGNVPGDHAVIFAGDKDTLILKHRALDPVLFAQGAIRAAQWLSGKPPGLYSMDDVVELTL